MTHRRRTDFTPTTALLLVGLLALFSVGWGAVATTPLQLWEALTAYDATDRAHVVLWAIRLPRVIGAVLIGGALAVAGACIQGLTRNPLAEPGILGIEAGAALAVVAGSVGLGWQSGLATSGLALIGAALSIGCVMGLQRLSGGLRPQVMIIAGAALSAGLSAVTTSVLLVDQQALQAVRFWLAGGLAGRSWSVIAAVSPVLVVGLVGAALLARHITALALGPHVAQSLGVTSQRAEWYILACVVCLTAGSVALAGPVGFVGLVVPHTVRVLVGSDFRRLVPASFVGGGVLVLAADAVARTVAAPHEIPLGVVMALIGGPFFLLLVRQHGQRSED